ncbi:MAG: hypothetical protein ACKVPX_11520, partial [Myxococcaceae bacterium]
INSPFDVVRSGASLIADAATRSLIEGSDFGDNIMAALPNVIGQTIGEAIAGGIARAGDRHATTSGSGQKSDVSKAEGVCQTPSTDDELSPRERYLQRVEELQGRLEVLDEMTSAELGADADARRLAASAEAEALYDEVKEFAWETDGWAGVAESYIGGGAGTVVGLPQGFLDSVVGLWNAVTHPVETLQGLWALGERASDYVGRNVRGEANALSDANVRARMFDAAVDLEQTRIYLEEGNAAAGYFVGNQAGRIVGSVAGPAKLAEVMLASRAARAGEIARTALRAQVRALRSLGVDRAGRRAFMNGETVPFQFATSSGEAVYGFVQNSDGRLVSQLFSISESNPTAALGAFLKFRNDSTRLARASGANTLELQGGSVINPRVEQFLLNQGFQPRTVAVPSQLGGGTQQVLSREFSVRR